METNNGSISLKGEIKVVDLGTEETPIVQAMDKISSFTSRTTISPGASVTFSGPPEGTVAMLVLHSTAALDVTLHDPRDGDRVALRVKGITILTLVPDGDVAVSVAPTVKAENKSDRVPATLSVRWAMANPDDMPDFYDEDPK